MSTPATQPAGPATSAQSSLSQLAAMSQAPRPTDAQSAMTPGTTTVAPTHPQGIAITTSGLSSNTSWK